MLLALSDATGVPLRDLDWMARERPRALDELWARATGARAAGRGGDRLAGETWEQARERVRAGRAANAVRAVGHGRQGRD